VNFETSPDRAFEELLESVVSRSPTVHDANRLTEGDAGPMTVETIQLYTSATGNDFTMYQAEEERGLDHVTQECERRLALLCALLVNQTDVRADQFSREKGLAFQKIGYPMGSLSCSIARSQDEFLQWDAEIVAEIKCEGYDDITRTLVSAFVLMDGIKWEGVRYLCSAVVDEIAALRLCKEHGFSVIRYLPAPSSLLHLKIPSWTFKKYKWSDTERVTTAVLLEQLSQSRLRIEIQFHDRFPEPTGWPDGDCWNVLQPRHVLQQFAATLRGSKGITD